MTLRAKLTLSFAIFAAVPMVAALWPVSRALDEALETEYAVRLDGAARAVEGEVRRLSAEAAESAREVARSPEIQALARDREAGLLDPAEVAPRAAEWMGARGLDVLAIAERDGEVVSSGHLPGRAGDVDPELRALFGQVGPDHATPRLVARATEDGVEQALALVAWEAVPGSGARLRVAAGLELGDRVAGRLASLTGGTVRILGEGSEQPIAAAAPRGFFRRVAERLVASPASRVRVIPVAAGPVRLARIEVSLSATGLARAEATVAVAFLATLVAAAIAASVLGHLVAGRVTRPLEALRAGAARVAAGDLDARVTATASGEVADLVRAFNAMTADLAASRARAAAAERVAAWREVARRLAHEIKNPLTPIAMSVETLREAYEQRRPDFDEILGEGTAAIQEEVRRLKRILDEFSRFARLPRPELKPVPADDLPAALLALYAAAPAGIAIERAIDPGLPAIHADRDQILQVLINLARNAVEAMGATGGTLRVGAHRDGGDVLFVIEDTGPGVSPEILPRLFEPDFTTKEGGTGLGLAIADRIVREHGGSIEVDSRPGQGTTFTVRLPAG